MAEHDLAIAPHVAERIARAQDMLGRLGARPAYEPNYATEKLLTAARAAIEACALLGVRDDELRQLAAVAHDHAAAMRERICSPASGPSS